MALPVNYDQVVAALSAGRRPATVSQYARNIMAVYASYGSKRSPSVKKLSARARRELTIESWDWLEREGETTAWIEAGNIKGKDKDSSASVGTLQTYFTALTAMATALGPAFEAARKSYSATAMKYSVLKKEEESPQLMGGSELVNMATPLELEANMALLKGRCHQLGTDLSVYTGDKLYEARQLWMQYAAYTLLCNGRFVIRLENLYTTELLIEGKHGYSPEELKKRNYMLIPADDAPITLVVNKFKSSGDDKAWRKPKGAVETKLDDTDLVSAIRSSLVAFPRTYLFSRWSSRADSDHEKPMHGSQASELVSSGWLMPDARKPTAGTIRVSYITWFMQFSPTNQLLDDFALRSMTSVEMLRNNYLKTDEDFRKKLVAEELRRPEGRRHPHADIYFQGGEETTQAPQTRKRKADDPWPKIVEGAMAELLAIQKTERATRKAGRAVQREAKKAKKARTVV